MLFRLFFILNIFAFTMGCKEDPPQPVLKFTDGNGTLAVGQTGIFYTPTDSIPLKIKFVKVTNDSRCPKGANCIWEGQISAEIIINESNIVNIYSTSDKQIIIGKKLVELTDAIPYPIVNESINPLNYKLTFVVKDL